jgi:hypothetical protein
MKYHCSVCIKNATKLGLLLRTGLRITQFFFNSLKFSGYCMSYLLEQLRCLNSSVLRALCNSQNKQQLFSQTALKI